MRSPSRLWLLTALLGSAALLTACSGGAAEGSTEGAEGPLFDEPYTFESGWVVTISSPEPIDGETDTYAIEVTVENGTDTEHNPTYDFVEAYADGGVADSYYDRDAGIGGPPDLMVPPREQEVFGVGFLAQDLATVEVVVTSTVALSSGGESEEAVFRTTGE